MAQSLLLPARTLAQVIPLPGAAPHPVQQQRGVGRRPPHIVNLSRWKFERKCANAARSEAAGMSVEEAGAFMRTCERLLLDARTQYVAAQQRTSS